MDTQQKPCEIGIIGLGVMGRNLMLNIAEKGFLVAGYDTDITKVKSVQEEHEDKTIISTGDLAKFISSLRLPRAIIILVPAGSPVDAVINNIQPLLHQGDIIIDAGNSFFKDTDIRASKLEQKGILFIGSGISGGKEGARRGPSIMPGGNKEAYLRVCHVFSLIAAKANDMPCVAYLGSGSVGHYVKMVHNGIEYAMMQLISEVYDFMKRGLCLNNDEICTVIHEWNQGELNCYLLEITEQIFRKKDVKTGKFLIDEILDVAGQNGTGMWTSESAMELQVPVPTIDTAVVMRNFSAMHNERDTASKTLLRLISSFDGDKNAALIQLHGALYTAMIITYAQGFSLLSKASGKYNFHLNPSTVAQIWRGGCIIRSAMLNDIMKAFDNVNKLPNLLLYPELSKKIKDNEKYLRHIIITGIKSSVPVPAMMSSLAYLDTLRSKWLPANLIQAQRDYFGDHKYQRYDSEGTFHTKW